MAWFWVPIITSRETFTVSEALDIRQMREEDVLKFLVAETLAPVLTFKWNSTSTLGNVWHLHHKSQENLVEASAGSSCYCFHWKLMMPVSYLIRQCHTIQEYWSATLMKFFASTRGIPCVDCLIPGNFTNQFRQPSRRHMF